MIQKIPLISLPPPFSFFFPSFLSPFDFLFFCLQFFEFSFKNLNQDLPGGPGVKNPPANAGDPGSILGLGRLHMLWGNLSPCATTTGEKPVHCTREQPPLTAGRESPNAAMKTQSSQK